MRELMEHLPAQVLNDLSRPLPVPQGYALLVGARLEACTAQTNTVLSAASILTPPFSLRRLAALVGHDPMDACDAAITAGLLQERPAGDEAGVEFPHPLTQSAVYQRLSLAVRTRLHLLAAESAVSDRERLQHRARAATGPDAELAGELADLARSEQRAGEWTSAGTHISLAASLTSDERARSRLVAEATSILVHAGSLDEAARMARRLPASAPQAIRSLVRGQLSQVAGNRDEAARLLTEAWNGTDASADPMLAALIAEHLAFLTLMSADTLRTEIWADRALAVPRPGPGPGSAHQIKLLALALNGSAEEALSTLTQVTDDDPPELLVGRGLIRIWAGDHHGAVADLEAVLGNPDKLPIHQRAVAY